MKLRHQLDYADSLRRPVAQCLGLRLRPYSIGMELELLRARSPFVMGNDLAALHALPESVQLEALIFACDTCSQSEADRAESSRLLAGGFPWTDWASRMSQIRLKNLWKRWEKHVLKTEIGPELDAFWQYLCAGRTGPEFAAPDDDSPGTPIGAPEMCILLHYVRNLHAERRQEWSATAESLDFPVAVARYEYYTMLETQGKVQLKSDFVQTFADWAAEQDAKVASGEIKLPDLNRPKEQEASCQP